MSKKNEAIVSFHASFLGPFLCRVNGKEVKPFTYEKLNPLLAILAFSRGNPVPKEDIINYLWPNKTEKNAKVNLRQALYQLRKYFAEDSTCFIESDRKMVRLLLPKDSSYDVDMFNEDAESPEEIEQSLAFFRGRFLQGMSVGDSSLFEDFLFTHRKHYYGIYLCFLKKNIRKLIERGDYEKALRTCFRYLEDEPWDEHIHLKIMQTYSAQGQKSSAVRHFEQLQESFKKELDVLPNEELCRFYDFLRSGKRKESQAEKQGEPEATSSSIFPTKNRYPVYSLPYFSRPAVEEKVEQSLLASQRMVSLVGQGGTGKTRLAYHIAEKLQPLYTDGCFLVSFASFSPRAIVTENEVLLFLMNQLSLTRDPSEPLEKQFFQLWAEKRVLFVLDNLEVVLSCGDFFERWLMASRHLQLLITTRSSLRLESEQVIPIQGFSLEENAHQNSPAIQFLFSCLEKESDVLEKAELSGEKVRELCFLVSGHPLLLTQVARWLKALTMDEVLEKIKGGEVTHEHTQHNFFVYAWSILFQEQRDCLLALSFLRGEIPKNILFRYLKVNPFVVLSLVEQGWLTRDVSRGSYQIHELQRQFLYQQCQQHEELFSKLERFFVAFFLRDCWEDESFQKESPETLKQVFSVWEHVQYSFERAVAFCDIELLRTSLPMLSALFSWTGQVDDGIRLFSLLLQSVPEDESSRSLREEGALLLASFLKLAGRPTEALEHLEKVGQTNKEFVVRKHLLLGEVHLSRHDFVSADKAYEEVKTYFHHSLSTRLLAQYHYSWSQYLLVKNNSDEVRDSLHKALQFALEADDTYLASLAYHGLGHFFYIQNDFEQTESYLEKFFALSSSFPSGRVLWSYTIVRGLIAYRRKDYEAADRTLSRTIAISNELGSQRSLVLPMIYLARTYFCQERDEECEALLHEAWKLTGIFAMRRQELLILSLFARLFRRTSRINEAHHLLLLCFARQQKQTPLGERIHSFLEWAQLFAAQGKKKEAFLLLNYCFSSESYAKNSDYDVPARDLLRRLFDELGEDECFQLQQRTLTLAKIEDLILSSSVTPTGEACPSCALYQHRSSEHFLFFSQS